MFYVLSLKWSKSTDRVLTWWGPNNSGYAFRLESAGRYTQAEIDAERGTTTTARARAPSLARSWRRSPSRSAASRAVP